MAKINLFKTNVIFVHGIGLSTFTEKIREIGAGPNFALSILTRTASLKGLLRQINVRSFCYCA